MYCISCGTQLADDAVFCQNCGTKKAVMDNNHQKSDVTKPTQAVTQQAKAKPNNTATQTNSSGCLSSFAGFCRIVAFVFLPLLAISAIFGFSLPGPIIYIGVIIVLIGLVLSFISWIINKFRNK